MKKILFNILKILLYIFGTLLIIGSVSLVAQGGELLSGIFSIVFGVLLFPIIYRKIKVLIYDKFKVKSEIKFIASYIIIFLFGYFISIGMTNYEITLKQKEEENKTKLEVTYNLKEHYTTNDKIEINIHQENIKDLQVNGKNINLIKNDITYNQTLNLGKNNIYIVGLNGKIKKEFHKEIERITKDEEQKRITELQKKAEEIKKQNELDEKLKKEQAEQERVKQEELAKQEQAKKEKEELDKKIKSQFSVWDGSHIGLTKFVKSNLKDPDSYEHIDTQYSLIKNKDNSYIITVFMKYRAKNSFGGYVIENIKAYYDLDGNPVNIENWVQS